MWKWDVPRLTAIGLACVVACGCGVLPLPNISNGDGGDSQPFTHHLSIARHADVPLSTGEIDLLLANATDLLNTVQTECPDVACPVTFERDGDVQEFDDVDSVVTSNDDMDKLFAKPQDIKLVSLMVGVCGASGPSSASVVIGCGFADGSVILVEDAPADVWAHEWGHVQGLPHRNDCPRNIMHATEVRTNAINTTERDAYLRASAGSAADRLRPLENDTAGAAEDLQRSEDQPIEAWVQDVVGRTYLQGVPAEVLGDAVDPRVTEALVAALYAERDANRMRNILRLLGLQGDPQAVDAVVQVLANLPRQFDTSHLAVAAEALLALGRLADADATGTALRYLVAGSDAQYWLDSGFATRQGSAAGASRALARLSILALGHASSAGAIQQLQGLLDTAQSSRVRDTSRITQIQSSLSNRWRAANETSEPACLP